MLSSFRRHQFLFPLRPSTSRLRPRCRFVSSTAHIGQGDDENQEIEEADTDVRPGGTDTYQNWIRTEGLKWRYSDPLGPKWLGGNVPFPRNPTFKPPAPLSDNLRTTIYEAYVTNPTANDFHALSVRYGVSIKRVQAIIRLKELEVQWKKVQQKPLQTGFLVGMETLLGVKVGGRQKTVSDEISSPTRDDVNEADELSRRSDDQDEQKRGLSRTFFELVDEGQEPLVPRLLEEQRGKVTTSRAERPEFPTTVVQPNPLKPPFKFVDVGLRWFNRKEAERRQKESVRRKAVKLGKRAAMSNDTPVSTSPP